MPLRATKDRILVLPVPPPDTASGIVLAPAYKLPPSQGRVISVGPAQLDVAVGSTISFKPFGGQVFLHDGSEYRLLGVEDVLLIDL